LLEGRELDEQPAEFVGETRGVFPIFLRKRIYHNSHGSEEIEVNDSSPSMDLLAQTLRRIAELYILQCGRFTRLALPCIGSLMATTLITTGYERARRTEKENLDDILVSALYTL
jgi:hypothetical protein